MIESIDLPRDPSSDLVSVIIPTYQDVDYLTEGLESLATQTYENIEAVIVDSSGVDWLRSLAEKSPDVRYFHQEPSGVSAARNRAIKEASGEYITFLDADDYYAETKIEAQVNALQGSTDIVYSDVYDIYPDGQKEYRTAMPISDPDEHHLFFFRQDGIAGNVQTSSVMVTADCLGDRRFCESLASKEDFHMWARLFRDCRAARIEQPLVFVRLHGDSISADPRFMYEGGIGAINRLVTEYPEFEPYAEERKRVERYNLGRELLISGEDDTSEARSVLATSLVKDRYYRAAVMLAVSLLPFGHAAVVSRLDRLRELLLSR
jgi:glycosyltransferase involved in cell wall biosynthesis